MEDKSCVAEWTNGQVPLRWCVDDDVNSRDATGVMLAWVLLLNISLHVLGSDIQLLHSP